MNTVFRNLVIIFVSLPLFAETARFDNPFEVKRMFGSVGRGDIVVRGRGQRVEADYEEFVNGDFSVVYTSDTTSPREIGFMSLPHYEPWAVGLDWKLVMSIKTNNPVVGRWQLSLIDRRGGQATHSIAAITDNEWKKLEFSAADFSPGYSRFDFTGITGFQIQAAIGRGNKIWFDDIHFVRNDGRVVGISDRSVDEFASQERNTRQTRIHSAFTQAKTSQLRNSLHPFFAKLYLDEDVERVNASLLEIFRTNDERIKRQYGLEQLWHLSLDSVLFRMYYTFSKSSKIFPGRLTNDTEFALLDLIWNRNEQRNDISLARQSSWWLVANETNDLISKTAVLLSSQIFMKERFYSDRIYPNTGTGGGYGYWFHSSDEQSKGPKGEGKFKDEGSYKALDHYYAYVEYFKKFFLERAKKGLFIEHGSSVYAQYSLMAIYDIYSMCEDRQIRELAGKFLDLYWSVWAQEQLAGIRGGARIRAVSSAPAERDSDYLMSSFLMGGVPDVLGASLSQTLSGYELPKAVWAIALDRKGLGQFESIARMQGQEQNLIPRPAGTERTLLCDTDSKLIRYNYITPDYIIGCRMDSPTAIHSYISNTGTKYGITFPSIPEPAVFLWGIEAIDEGNFVLSADSGNYRAVQHKNVMIIQQARNALSVSPQWFPQKNQLAIDVGININPAVDEVVERNGWIFIREGAAYLAIRVVKAEFVSGYRGSSDWFDHRASDSIYAAIDQDSYVWNRDRTIIKLKDIYSPVILNAGRKEDFKDLEGFISYVFGGRVALLKTVVPGWYILSYTTADNVRRSNVFEFNAANSQVPTVDGEPVEYSPAQLYNSPYIASDYDSGIIKVSKDEYELVLDFNL